MAIICHLFNHWKIQFSCVDAGICCTDLHAYSNAIRRRYFVYTSFSLV